MRAHAGQLYTMNAPKGCSPQKKTLLKVQFFHSWKKHLDGCIPLQDDVPGSVGGIGQG